jgi:hypothetical protein
MLSETGCPGEAAILGLPLEDGSDIDELIRACRRAALDGQQR